MNDSSYLHFVTGYILNYSHNNDMTEDYIRGEAAKYHCIRILKERQHMLQDMCKSSVKPCEPLHSRSQEQKQNYRCLSCLTLILI
ncbi:hypothetical protein SK128_022092 [Halocaridina rubra]|uniref:Uncharacterized protein n=1 Tax=Halocaridina rubra TaxID=373956 RepID=A0AAN8X6N6_HALRR